MIVNPSTFGDEDKSKGLTAKEQDILQGKTALVDGELVTGSMPEVFPSTPTITISEGGNITSSTVIADGHAASVRKENTKQMTTYPGGTIVPRASQTIVSTKNKYCTGDIIVSGSTDLKAENILSGKTIFGVNGSIPKATATSVTPGTTAKTAIKGGTYAVNDIVVSGDPDLKSGNILASANIFGIQGSVQNRTLPSPSISVSSSGLITASDYLPYSGYVSSGTKSSTYQMNTDGGGWITPGISNKTAVSSGKYTTGTTYVYGDNNLVSENIRSGISIFGVNGSFDGPRMSWYHPTRSDFSFRNGRLDISLDVSITGLVSVGFYGTGNILGRSYAFACAWDSSGGGYFGTYSSVDVRPTEDNVSFTDNGSSIYTRGVPDFDSWDIHTATVVYYY